MCCCFVHFEIGSMCWLSVCLTVGMADSCSRCCLLLPLHHGVYLRHAWHVEVQEFCQEIIFLENIRNPMESHWFWWACIDFANSFRKHRGKKKTEKRPLNACCPAVPSNPASSWSDWSTSIGKRITTSFSAAFDALIESKKSVIKWRYFIRTRETGKRLGWFGFRWALLFPRR